jgi:geranylgeranyl diphosphate synthase type II
VLNLAGDPVRYGKELGGDLWEGKRTLMLLHLLRSADPAERSRLADFLAQPRRERRAADVAWVRERMDAHGSVAHAQRTAHALAGAARHESEAVLRDTVAGRDARFIAALPTWVLERR